MKMVAYRGDKNQAYENPFRDMYPFSEIGRCIVDSSTGDILEELSEDNIDLNKECEPSSYYHPSIYKIFQSQEGKPLEITFNNNNLCNLFPRLNGLTTFNRSGWWGSLITNNGYYHLLSTYKDEIYVGLPYSNLFVESYMDLTYLKQFFNLEFYSDVKKIHSKIDSTDVKFKIGKMNDGNVYTISFDLDFEASLDEEKELILEIYFKDGSPLNRETKLKLGESKHIVYSFEYISDGDDDVIYIKPNKFSTSGDLVTISNILVTNTMEELPYLPPNTSISSPGMEWEASDSDYNFNSNATIIIKGIKHHNHSDSKSYVFSSYTSGCIFYCPKDRDYIVFKPNYNEEFKEYRSGLATRLRFGGKTTLGITNIIRSFTQILIYNKVLTDEEIEEELKKDKYPLHFSYLLTNEHEIMTRIPAFYYKRTWDGDTIKESILTDKIPNNKETELNDGYKVHPAFIRPDGTVRPYVLVGSFLGTLSNSTLRSNPNFNVLASGTIASLRDYARNGRDVRWNLMNIDILSMIQTLFKILFQTLDSQSILGTGSTTSNLSNSGNINYSRYYGNKSGTKFNDNRSNSDSTFLGIEHMWGIVSQPIEGLITKVNDGFYYTNDISRYGFYDDYKKISSEIPVQKLNAHSNTVGLLRDLGDSNHLNIFNKISSDNSYRDYTWYYNTMDYGLVAHNYTVSGSMDPVGLFQYKYGNPPDDSFRKARLVFLP